MEKIKLQAKKNGIKMLKTIFILFIIILIVFTGMKEVKSIDFAKTIMTIRGLSLFKILLFTILGIFAISSMSLYDFSIVKHLELDIGKITVFSVSFLANIINNISGLGGLTGASIRALLFKKSLGNKSDIVEYNLLLIPATGIGLSIMTLISLFKYDFVQSLADKYRWIYLIITVFLLYGILYFLIDWILVLVRKKKGDSLNRNRIILRGKLLLYSLIEWLSAFLLFLVIVRQFNKLIGPYTVFAIFTIGSAVGIASLLPSGVGSFDLLVLLGLQYYGMEAEEVLAVLILYRSFYYILPLIIGLIFTLGIQTQKENKSPVILDLLKIKDFINKTSGITNWLLAILIFTSGAVLLFSALVPGIIHRVKLASRLLSFPILQFSRQLSICIGILLMAVAREIKMKVKRSYKFTMWLLIFGAFLTLIKGLDYEEAIFLLAVSAILKMSKNSFYRKSIPIDWFQTFITLLFAFIGIFSYAKVSHIIIRDFLKLEFFRVVHSNRIILPIPNGVVYYGILIGFLVIYELSKEKIYNDEKYKDFNEDELNRFLKEFEGNFLTHLLFLKDKNVFWSKDHRVLIQYGIRHNLVIVLGDLVGDCRFFEEALTDFQKFIDIYGYKSAFYQVSENLLPLYHDYGYNFFKLEETALVDLEGFDIMSPKCRDHRNILRRFEKDGYDFQFLEERFIGEDLYISLKGISEQWIYGKREMGFSLGRFQREYLEKSKIGIVRNAETKEIIAFASINPSYDHGESASIDLMRFKNDVPNNTMTFLILNIILTLKTNGYKVLNLGMAPLANVGTRKTSHLKEKLAHVVFRYGKHFYSFDGLRNYKNKFAPNWEGRYLVYEDPKSLPTSLLEITWLIHSK
ncbi:MAG: bifunctional lysylphosphatidylglycerol flippase/synthetase MprF [Tissierellaceae bacterium]